MIINIRGTSGSGKSTLVRRVMELYGGPKVVYREEGRKQPIGYALHRAQGVPGRPLGLIGHYETACGGCDTVPKMDRIFELVREAHANGMDVLFEGLLISADFNRTYALHADGLPLLVVGLDVPLDVCLDSVNQRRWAKNPNKPPVNPKNTESKWKGTKNTMKKLQEHGVDARWADREGAFKIIRGALDV